MEKHMHSSRYSFKKVTGLALLIIGQIACAPWERDLPMKTLNVYVFRNMMPKRQFQPNTKPYGGDEQTYLYQMR